MTVVIGTELSAPRYTLPATLLMVHSLYFRTEITRLKDLAAISSANKKRKYSPDMAASSGEDGDIEGVKTSVEHYEQNEMVIQLPDVDPAIFGLFLKYIYQGMYPAIVDARTSHVQYASYVLSTQTVSAQAAAQTLTTNSPRSAPNALPKTNKTGPPPSKPATTAPRNMTPAAAGNHVNGITHTEVIPPSIRAWLLGQSLKARDFMNHAIGRIYAGIGMHFALTPSLIDHVWVNTAHAPISPSAATMTCSGTSASTTDEAIVGKGRIPLSSSGDILALKPNPLRALLLAVLVTYWSSTSAHTIARSASLNAVWNALFDTHHDLRRDFILGLQGGIKVMPVQGYYVSSTHAPPRVVAGDPGKESDGVKVKVEQDVMEEGKNGVMKNDRGANLVKQNDGKSEGVENGKRT